MTNRREFIVRSVAASVAIAATPALGAEAVVETDVLIKTEDGTCDACFTHPSSGSHPGVLIWPDALGLRPTMRAMARRLAAERFSVLVPIRSIACQRHLNSKRLPTSTSATSLS